MRHQKSEMRSLVTFKKEELFDQLLDSLETEESGTGDNQQSRPLWILITNYKYGEDHWKYPGPILEEDKANLTRYFRRNELPRVIQNLGGCRNGPWKTGRTG